MALFDWETHYEVQVLDGDRWAIVAASREAEEARETALRLLGRPEFAGVRVVREMRERRGDRAAACVLFERVRPRRISRLPIPARTVTRRITPLVSARPAVPVPSAPPEPVAGPTLPTAAILAGAALGLLLLLLAVLG